jgi:hypothetical protein
MTKTAMVTVSEDMLAVMRGDACSVMPKALAPSAEYNGEPCTCGPETVFLGHDEDGLATYVNAKGFGF